VTQVLGSLSKEDAAWWSERLHVVSGRGRELETWLADVMHGGMGDYGFAIDRAQTLRGVGSFADIDRYDNAIPDWPFANNLVYGPTMHSGSRSMRHDGHARPRGPRDPGWQGEVISQYADMPIAFPTRRISRSTTGSSSDVDMRCPDRTKPEFNNCGAWDYIANVFVDDGTGTSPRSRA
jgi:hypothetical protein